MRFWLLLALCGASACVPYRRLLRTARFDEACRRRNEDPRLLDALIAQSVGTLRVSVLSSTEVEQRFGSGERVQPFGPKVLWVETAGLRTPASLALSLAYWDATISDGHGKLYSTVGANEGRWGAVFANLTAPPSGDSGGSLRGLLEIGQIVAEVAFSPLTLLERKDLLAASESAGGPRPNERAAAARAWSGRADVRAQQRLWEATRTKLPINAEIGAFPVLLGERPGLLPGAVPQDRSWLILELRWDFLSRDKSDTCSAFAIALVSLRDSGTLEERLARLRPEGIRVHELRSHKPW